MDLTEGLILSSMMGNGGGSGGGGGFEKNIVHFKTNQGDYMLYLHSEMNDDGYAGVMINNGRYLLESEMMVETTGIDVEFMIGADGSIRTSAYEQEFFIEHSGNVEILEDQYGPGYYYAKITGDADITIRGSLV